MYNPNIHHRRSIRLKEYDYSQEGLYFLTLCTTDRLHIFGEIENGEMKLNTFGEIANKEWLKTIEIRKNIELLAYIIMPNHIHGIIEIKYSLNNENKKEIGKFKSPSQTIGAIIRGYKGATTKRIKEIIRGEIKDNISTGESIRPDRPNYSITFKNRFIKIYLATELLREHYKKRKSTS